MNDPQAQFYVGCLEGIAEGIESGGCPSDSTVPKRLREIAEWIKSNSPTDLAKQVRDFDDRLKAIGGALSGRSSIG